MMKKISLTDLNRIFRFSDFKTILNSVSQVSRKWNRISQIQVFELIIHKRRDHLEYSSLILKTKKMLLTRLKYKKYTFGFRQLISIVDFLFQAKDLIYKKFFSN